MNTESILVSVIVPIYNVEFYLERCIESLVKQTHQNLEIILINDGSLDDSLKICLDWRKKDKRILVLDKANGGQGPARNLGCKIASGEYVAFVDSDDWVDEEYMECMLQTMLYRNAQIAFCDYNRVTADGLSHYIALSSLAEHGICPDDNPEIIHDAGICYWNKLFKKQLLDELSIVQPNHTAEDLCTQFVILCKADKIVQVRRALYNYYVREGSSSYQAEVPKQYQMAFTAAGKNFLDYRLDKKYWYYLGKIFLSGLNFNRMLNNKDPEFQRGLQEMECMFQDMFMNERNPGSMNYIVIGSFDLRSEINQVAFKPYPYFGFSSLISMMSDGYHEKILITHDNPFREDAVRKDFNSTINQMLQNDTEDIDYIFIDFLEERFDILDLGENNYITKSEALTETETGKAILEQALHTIPSGSGEFITLWQKACSCFIELLKSKFQANQVIVVKNRLSERYGSLQDKRFYDNRTEITNVNALIEQMENFFLEHYEGVQTMEIKEEALLYTDEHYRYGIYPWHLNPYLYTKIANDICRILK